MTQLPKTAAEHPGDEVFLSLWAPAAKKAGKVADEVLKSLDFNLVSASFEPRGRRQALVILAETSAGAGITLGDCEKISKALSPALDVAEAVNGPYYLEIASCGIDRPLVRRRDFEKAVGKTIKVKFNRPIEGSSQLKGILNQISGNSLLLHVENKGISVPVEALAKAKLVLDESLLKPTQNTSTVNQG